MECSLHFAVKNMPIDLRGPVNIDSFVQLFLRGTGNYNEKLLVGKQYFHNDGSDFQLHGLAEVF